MTNPNRIDSISLSRTLPRQTPKNEFGQVLASTVGKAANVGGSLLQGAATSNPVISAAASGIASLAQPAVGSVLPVDGAAPASRAALETGAGAAAGDPWSVIQDQSASSREFLLLQMAMQHESRQFTTVSNVSKVRHDSAKAAINNIR